MSNQSFYYAISMPPDELGPCWYGSHRRGGCLQMAGAPLPHTVYTNRRDARVAFAELKEDFPKESDGAKIVLIGINYNI